MFVIPNRSDFGRVWSWRGERDEWSSGCDHRRPEGETDERASGTPGLFVYSFFLFVFLFVFLFSLSFCLYFLYFYSSPFLYSYFFLFLSGASRISGLFVLSIFLFSLSFCLSICSLSIYVYLSSISIQVNPSIPIPIFFCISLTWAFHILIHTFIHTLVN